ncbi:uncharacterized protein phf11 isoform X2 [Anarhichas minor]|uniref:uncharacterized protein phf11 isoform X2 n=1 Tax=Anarhichas minor TaxID=65739 RepID=UPI003F74071F
MDDINKVYCLLCQRCEETAITGALSTKDEVTAHQNCLLFSSGLYCRNSPQFDDLFGFSVEDVLKEVKRGSKLMCNKCQTKGATAGCEVKRCKKSYHYPCAVRHRAKIVEDADQGKYGLYCSKHSQQTQENNGSVNGHPSSFAQSRTSKSPSEAGSSKVHCLACEKTEGNISLESVSNGIHMRYCNKHAPASHKRSTSGDSTTARHAVCMQPVCSSDSSSRVKPSSSKRRLIFGDGQEWTLSKRKRRNAILTDDSSNSSYNEPDSEMNIFAPVETDFDESANSVPETQTVCQVIRKDNPSPTGSTSGNQLEDESINGETIIHSVKCYILSSSESDGESESLLPPVSQPPSATMAVVSTQTTSALLPSVVRFKTEVEESQRTDGGCSPDQSPVHCPAEQATGPAVPQQRSAGPPPSPPRSKPLDGTRSPAPPSDPEPSLDSASFWKSCNAAGCTQALFIGFIDEMNDISSRIQSDLARQEDYDHALTVMSASGKLAERVAKQQEELQRKQTELQKASTAMKDVVSALWT